MLYIPQEKVKEARRLRYRSSGHRISSSISQMWLWLRQRLQAQRAAVLRTFSILPISAWRRGLLAGAAHSNWGRTKALHAATLVSLGAMVKLPLRPLRRLRRDMLETCVEPKSRLSYSLGCIYYSQTVQSSTDIPFHLRACYVRSCQKTGTYFTWMS